MKGEERRGEIRRRGKGKKRQGDEKIKKRKKRR